MGGVGWAWMNLYHLRLTIPQKVSIIEIPMSNGDWVRCLYPGEAPQSDVKCVLYHTWMSQLRQLMMTVGAQRFISKAPHLHNEATWSNTTQHNISAARRERESASERVRGNHALLPLFSLLLPTAAPFIDYSVYTLLLTYNTCSNVRTSSKSCKVRCVYFHYHKEAPLNQILYPQAIFYFQLPPVANLKA